MSTTKTKQRGNANDLALARLKRENKRLRSELAAARSRPWEQPEASEDIRSDALAHARKQLEALNSADPFTHTMDLRAIDAITELIGR